MNQLTVSKAIYAVGAAITVQIALGMGVLAAWMHQKGAVGGILTAIQVLMLFPAGFCIAKSVFYHNYIKGLSSEDPQKKKCAMRYFAAEGLGMKDGEEPAGE